jgi:hypothetical protein
MSSARSESRSGLLHPLTCSCEVDVVGDEGDGVVELEAIAARYKGGRWMLPERWLADAGCCERRLLGTRVAVNAGRCER